MRNETRSAAALSSRRAARTIHNGRQIVRGLSRLRDDTLTPQEREKLLQIVDKLDKVINELADPAFLHPTLF